MAHIRRDRVLETSTTTGTGDFTLAGPYTGYRSFSGVCSTGDTVQYYIEAIDGDGAPTGDWETGLGTYSAANTLTRTTIYDSSSGSAVNFSAGTKRVGMAPLATPYFQGALVKKSADQTTANYTAATDITWDAESYDTSGFHDTSSNTARLTIPTGVTRVRLSAHVRGTLHTADSWTSLVLQKNGSASFDGGSATVWESGASSIYIMLTSPVLVVTAGDYFTVSLQVESDTSITVDAARSWFAIEVVT